MCQGFRRRKTSRGRRRQQMPQAQMPIRGVGTAGARQVPGFSSISLAPLSRPSMFLLENASAEPQGQAVVAITCLILPGEASAAVAGMEIAGMPCSEKLQLQPLGKVSK